MLVFRRPCVLLERHAEPAFEVTADCTACGACITIGCPALAKDEETGHALIDAPMCIGCGQCAQYCARGAIKPAAEKGGAHA